MSPAAADPPGFNGTVKIHEEPGEAEPIRRNEPHVCVFHVHGFNFDTNARGWFRIDAWAPTAGNAGLSQRDWGPASAAGEWKSGAITLTPGHYKLFFDQTSPPAPPGGQKHKVFWVECPTQGTSTTGGGTSSSSSGTSSTGNANSSSTGNANSSSTGNANSSTTTTSSTGGAVGTSGSTTTTTTGGNVGSTTGGAVSGTTGAGVGTTGGAVAGAQTMPQPQNNAVAGLETLPSTRTEGAQPQLLGLGAALMLMGAMLMLRKRSMTKS